MWRKLQLAASALAGVLFASAQTPYTWNLPAGFPKPRVPIDNPMTAEKVELGRYLFYDARMSANGTRKDGPVDNKAARSIRFCNSRMLPGQL